LQNEEQKQKKKKKRQEKKLKPPNETSFTLVDPMHQLASTPLFDVTFPFTSLQENTRSRKKGTNLKPKGTIHSLGDISYTTWSI
jgi:hypothetical protein